MESHTVPQQPTVSIDALETFVELLARVDADPATDDFYSRLCEATCRLADMDRAVIFRYDGARRRVRAAGAYGIDLELFAELTVPRLGGDEPAVDPGHPGPGGRQPVDP